MKSLWRLRFPCDPGRYQFKCNGQILEVTVDGDRYFTVNGPTSIQVHLFADRIRKKPILLASHHPTRTVRADHGDGVRSASVSDDGRSGRSHT